MIKKQNKGFTIVEIVIVIAVVAVLAAVLVPTFSGVIAKANISNDTQVVSMLNKSVKADLASKGQAKHDTMYDAVQACVLSGIKEKQIVSKSDYNIGWNAENGEFALLDLANNSVFYPEEASMAGKEESYYIVTTYDERIEKDANFKYSIYAYGDWSDNSTVKVHSNFDAGSASGIEKVVYENLGEAKDIVIRTNSQYTDLEVNAPLDTIKHYGQFRYLNVIACAPHTLVEYGNGVIVEMKTGHIEIKNDSNIKHIHFTLDEFGQKFDDISVSLDKNATLPEISRDPVEIPKEGVKVCSIDSVEYWLTADGVYDEIKTKNAGEEVFNEIPKTELQDTNSEVVAQSICNGYKVDGNGAAVVDSNNKKIVVDGGKEASTVKNDAIAIATADSWEDNKSIDTSWYKEGQNTFVIYKASQLAGFAALVNGGTSFKGKTVKLGANLNLYPNRNTKDGDENHERIGIGRDNSSYNDKCNMFEGTFDGQGYSILNVYEHCYIDYTYDKSYGLFGAIKNATIKNLTVSAELWGEYNYIYYGHAIGAVCGVAWGDCTFENITVKDSRINGYILSAAGVIGGTTHGTTTLKNITVEDTVEITTWYNAVDTQMGGVIGAIDIGTDANTKVIMEDVTVKAHMYPLLDSAGAYQWFQYRSAGTLVGGFCQDSYGLDSNTYSISDEDAAKHLTCKNVKVYYDSWADQTYCEFHELGHGSYSGEGDWKTAYIYPDDETVYTRTIGDQTYEVKVGDLSTHKHYEDEMHAEVKSFFQLIGGRNVRTGSTSIRKFEGVTQYRYGELYTEVEPQ